MSLKISFIVTKADFSRVLASAGRFVSNVPPMEVIDLPFVKDIVKYEARERLFITAFNGEAGIQVIMSATPDCAVQASNGDFPGQSARTGTQPITIDLKARLLPTEY